MEGALEQQLQQERQMRIQAEAELEEKERKLKIANHSLERFASHLEKEVEARTRELASARDEALAFAAAKDEFLMNMSHEIRTPLNGVMGMLFALKNTELSKRQQQQIEVAVGSCKILLQVINDILEFSKFQNMGVELDPHHADIRRTVVKVLKAFEGQAKSKGLELKMDIAANVPSCVWVDEFRLSQILYNLVSNAIKFTEQGCVQVVLQVVDNSMLRVSVIDSGVGVPAQKKQSIFDAFEQADTSITRQFGGTGLGLSICSYIALAFNSKMQLSDMHEGGTQFYFDYPLVKSPGDFSACAHPGVELSFAVCAMEDVPAHFRKILAQAVDSLGGEYLELSAWQQFIQQKLHHEGAKKQALIVVSGNENLYDHRSNDFAESQDLAFFSWHVTDQKLTSFTHIFDLYSQSDATLEEVCQQVSLFFSKKAEFLARNESVVEEDNRSSEKQNLNVLIVDDNPTNLMVAEELLCDFGWQITTCDSGDEACNKELLRDVDAILMDIQMPEMDGYTTARKIKDLGPPFNQIPIIAMTAHASFSAKEKSLAQGMSAHICKPIDPEEVYKTIKDHVEIMVNEPLDSNPAHVGSDGSTSYEKLQGINHQQVKQRFAGKSDRYLDIVASFVKQFRNVAQDLSSAMAQQDKAKILSLLHTLKGSAANISAENIYNNSSRLESVLEVEWLDVKHEAVTGLLEAITELTDSFEKINKEKSVETYYTLDSEALRQNLKNINELINSDLYKAKQAVKSLEVSKVPEVDEDFIETLIDAFKQFDLEKSEALIHHYLSRS